MDFINKSLAQLNDLFRQMTPAARITAGLLLGLVVISLGYLFTTGVNSGDVFLLGGQGFSASEMTAMEAAFGKAKLGGYTVMGNRIKIPHGQQAAYMAALADNSALPAHFGDYLTDAMGKAGPFTSRAQQEELIKAAKQRELALIIRSMAGIENAAVHYDTQRKGGLRGGAVTTASVSVKSQGNQPLDERQVPMIRHLVAGAIAGLSPEAVTVVDLNGRTYSGASTSGGILGSASDDPYLTRVRAYQAMYEEKIATALAFVPGVTITTHVELDRELVHRSQKDVFDPKQSAPILSREESSTSTTDGGAGGGRPGFEGQQPGANAAARLSGGGGNSKSSDEKSVTEVTNAPSVERVQVDFAALTPKRVTASVAVPVSYFEGLWHRRNPAPAGQTAKAPDAAALDAIQREETVKIRQHVERILPAPAAGADAANPVVTVTTFTNLPSNELAGPSTTDKALGWLGAWWNTLALLALVGFSLLMLRSFLRSSTPAESVAAAATPAPTLSLVEEPVDEQQEPAAEKAKSRLKRRTATGPSLREELVDLVREDPDAAANILRSWIGNTG